MQPTNPAPPAPPNRRFNSSAATTNLGATVLDGGLATRFRVYSERTDLCQIRILESDGARGARGEHPLQPSGDGAHEGIIEFSPSTFDSQSEQPLGCIGVICATKKMTLGFWLRN